MTQMGLSNIFIFAVSLSERKGALSFRQTQKLSSAAQLSFNANTNCKDSLQSDVWFSSQNFWCIIPFFFLVALKNRLQMILLSTLFCNIWLISLHECADGLRPLKQPPIFFCTQKSNRDGKREEGCSILGGCVLVVSQERGPLWAPLLCSSATEKPASCRRCQSCRQVNIRICILGAMQMNNIQHVFIKSNRKDVLWQQFFRMCHVFSLCQHLVLFPENWVGFHWLLRGFWEKKKEKKKENWSDFSNVAFFSVAVTTARTSNLGHQTALCQFNTGFLTHAVILQCNTDSHISAITMDLKFVQTHGLTRILVSLPKFER